MHTYSGRKDCAPYSSWNSLHNDGLTRANVLPHIFGRYHTQFRLSSQALGCATTVAMNFKDEVVRLSHTCNGSYESTHWLSGKQEEFLINILPFRLHNCNTVHLSEDISAYVGHFSSHRLNAKMQTFQKSN